MLTHRVARRRELRLPKRAFRPLGFAAGDQNLYRYVRNRPNENSDPSGGISTPTISTGLNGVMSGRFRSWRIRSDRPAGWLDDGYIGFTSRWIITTPPEDKLPKDVKQFWQINVVNQSIMYKDGKVEKYRFFVLDAVNVRDATGRWVDEFPDRRELPLEIYRKPRTKDIIFINEETLAVLTFAPPKIELPEGQHEEFNLPPEDVKLVYAHLFAGGNGSTLYRLERYIYADLDGLSKFTLGSLAGPLAPYALEPNVMRSKKVVEFLDEGNGEVFGAIAEKENKILILPRVKPYQEIQEESTFPRR